MNVKLLKKWLQDHTTSPITRQIISKSNLIPNRAIKIIIEEYYANNRNFEIDTDMIYKHKKQGKATSKNKNTVNTANNDNTFATVSQPPDLDIGIILNDRSTYSTFMEGVNRGIYSTMNSINSQNATNNMNNIIGTSNLNEYVNIANQIVSRINNAQDYDFFNINSLEDVFSPGNINNIMRFISDSIPNISGTPFTRLN
jgi:hypothetical protein